MAVCRAQWGHLRMTAFSFLAMYLSDSCGSGAEVAGYPGLAAVSTSVVVSLGGKGSGSRCPAATHPFAFAFSDY